MVVRNLFVVFLLFWSFVRIVFIFWWRIILTRLVVVLLNVLMLSVFWCCLS